MAISPLLSLAGTALAPLAREVVGQITDGLSFQRLLASGDTSHANDVAAAGEDSAARFAESPEAARLDAIRRQPRKELEAYVDRLRHRLSAAGIDLTEPIPLKVGHRGDIQVDGQHPDRAAIEDLLAADSQLTSTFRLLANAFNSQNGGASADRLANEFRLTIDASKFNLGLE